MNRFRLIAAIVLLTSVSMVHIDAQTVELNGRVIASGDVENIHVINESSSMFTTTNVAGLFRITAKYQDTIKFTSVQYKTAVFVVTYKAIQEGSFDMYLEEQVNVLDEVIVGKILTGKLDSDIENSNVERPVDFYDLGIPGYVGKPLTQSERRVAEASKGQPGTLAILPIINAITGRTKMLKERVRLEGRTSRIKSIKDNLGPIFFSSHSLDEKWHEEFYQYCTEHEDFDRKSKSGSDLLILEFMDLRLKEFMLNLESRKN